MMSLNNLSGPMIADIDKHRPSSLQLLQVDCDQLARTMEITLMDHEETGSGCFWIILVGLRQILAPAAAEMQ